MALNFGYMRVSSTGQNLDRQGAVLLEFVSFDENEKPYLFSDKASGKDMDRVGFQEMYRVYSHPLPASVLKLEYILLLFLVFPLYFPPINPVPSQQRWHQKRVSSEYGRN